MPLLLICTASTFSPTSAPVYACHISDSRKRNCSYSCPWCPACSGKLGSHSVTHISAARSAVGLLPALHACLTCIRRLVGMSTGTQACNSKFPEPLWPVFLWSGLPGQWPLLPVALNSAVLGIHRSGQEPLVTNANLIIWFYNCCCYAEWCYKSGVRKPPLIQYRCVDLGPRGHADLMVRPQACALC